MRVAVVAPIPAVRSGLRAMLNERLSSDSPAGSATPLLVLEGATLADAAEWLDEIDVLVLDASASHLDVLQGLADRQAGRLALLLLADDLQAVQGLARLPLRAWGVLPMDCSADELIAAVWALEAGLLVSAPPFSRQIFSQFLEASDAVEKIEPLTGREGEVLQLLAQGLANKQIAASLHISEHTVKFHVSSIFSKLGAASRTEAVRTGVQRGLVTL